MVRPLGLPPPIPPLVSVSPRLRMYRDEVGKSSLMPPSGVQLDWATCAIPDAPEYFPEGSDIMAVDW